MGNNNAHPGDYDMTFLALNIETKAVITTGFDRNDAANNARMLVEDWESFCVRPINNPELNHQAADAMEAENLHTERAIFLAHCLNTAHGTSIIYLLTEIAGRAELAGEMEHHDITLRDALARECVQYLKIQGKF